MINLALNLFVSTLLAINSNVTDNHLIKNIANESCGFPSLLEVNRKHTTVVGYHIMKTKRKPPFGRMLTDRQEKKISYQYLNGKSINDLRRIYGLGEKLVRNVLRRTNTLKRTKSEAISLYYKTEEGIQKGIRHGGKIKKYIINEDFFSRPLNQESAYVFGFYIADGHIGKGNKNLLCFSQTEKDILIKIKEAMSSSNPIYKKKRGEHILSISNRKICNDVRALCTFDLTKPKSHVANYPKIPKKLDSHFIRGVFDGDGGLWYAKSGQLVIGMTGTMKLNREIQKRFIENCGVGENKINDMGNFSYMSYGGNKQVFRILNWLYRGASIYMDRKKNIYDLICKKKLETN